MTATFCLSSFPLEFCIWQGCTQGQVALYALTCLHGGRVSLICSQSFTRPAMFDLELDCTVGKDNVNIFAYLGRLMLRILATRCVSNK